MALRSKSGFLYNYQVTPLNRFINFKTSALGAELTATLRLGSYGLTELTDEIERALEAADAFNSYSCTVNRTILAGTQNRITITTVSGTFFSLLFSSGTDAANSAASLLGFPATDQTGSLTYTGTSSTGIYLFPTQIAYSYQPIESLKKAQGVVNISASGVKEVVTFSVNEFFQLEFKFEPQAKAFTEWAEFFIWAIKQPEVEFIPDINDPNTIIRCTLETTDSDGKGLGYMMREMLPEFPFFYRTGILRFRKVVI